jgi:tetratricopeptide (TPR) repeat protein
MFNLAAAIAGIRSDRSLPSSWLDSAIVRYDHLLSNENDSDEKRDLKAAIYAWMTKLNCIDQAKMYKPSLWQKTTSEFLARSSWIPNEENALLEAIELGIAKYRIGDCRGAIETLSVAISESPENARLYNYRGLAYLDSGNNPMAQNDLEQAVQLGSQDPRTFYSLGTIQSDAGEDSAAIANLTRAISINPSFYLGYLKRADLLKNRGSFAAAINDYDECLSIRENEWVAMLGRAEARICMGDFETAEQDIEHALDYSPNDPHGLEMLAECKRQLNREDQAVAIIDRLLLTDPWNVHYLTLHAQIQLDQGFEDGAIQSLQKALKQDPINPAIQRLLGSLLTSKVHGDLHDFSFGLRLLKKANRATNEADPVCLTALATAYHFNGMSKEAQSLQSKALSLIDQKKDPQTWNEYRELLLRYEGKSQKKRAS